MDTLGIVYVVDDDAEVRHSWEAVLAAGDLRVEGYASAEAFLEAADLGGVCCLVLDLRMPGMGGEELLERLRGLGSRLPVVVVSGHADVPAVIQTMRLGVVDFLTKPVDPEALVKQVRGILCKAAALRGRDVEEEKARTAIGALTEREREVLELLVRGKLHKQVARELGISTRTVDHHHAQINLKTGANNLADLMRIGFVAGLGK
jgi:two-component system, LuxR family, response regulator FixJ